MGSAVFRVETDFFMAQPSLYLYYFLLRLWEVTVGEGGTANYQLRPELMS